MYALIETGGKQYRVAPGDTIEAELFEASPGDTVELDRVMLISDDKGAVTVGKPTVPGAKVVAKVVGEVKAKKVIVFKYKPKVRYKKKTGHRQRYTRMVVEGISGLDSDKKSKVKKDGTQKRRRQHTAGA